MLQPMKVCPGVVLVVAAFGIASVLETLRLAPKQVAVGGFLIETLVINPERENLGLGQAYLRQRVLSRGKVQRLPGIDPLVNGNIAQHKADPASQIHSNQILSDWERNQDPLDEGRGQSKPTSPRGGDRSVPADRSYSEQRPLSIPWICRRTAERAVAARSFV